MSGLTRRGAFGAAAVVATTAALPRAEAASLAAEGAGNAAEMRLSLGLTAKDRLDGVVGYVLRRAEPDEAPNVWAGFGENEWNGGVLYGGEDQARWAAAENWNCVRTIVHERAALLRQMKAAHVPARDYDRDHVMLSDDRVVGLEEAADYLFDDSRCWAWAADEESFTYDPDEELDEHLADWFEDAEGWIPDADRQPMREAWRALMAKHGASLTRYNEDSNCLVVFNEAEFAVETGKWVERLALCEAALARIRIEGPTATHLLHVTAIVCALARALHRDLERRNRWSFA